MAFFYEEAFQGLAMGNYEDLDLSDALNDPNDTHKVSLGAW